jgi:hypothetical protein
MLRYQYNINTSRLAAEPVESTVLGGGEGELAHGNANFLYETVERECIRLSIPVRGRGGCL